MAPPDYDVIVIGAGQAGLAAAHRTVSRHHLSVLVLEATDHVGGRTRNYDLGEGRHDVASDDAYELGGTWLSPDHTAVLALCREVGLDVYDASFLGDLKDGGGCSVDRNGGVRLPVAGDADDADEQDWPWWNWGVEYTDDEIQRLQKIILHVHSSEQESEEGGGDSTRKVTFRTAAELIAALDDKTRTELESVGRRIEDDCAALGDGNCWEKPNFGNGWEDLDAESTGEIFLGCPPHCQLTTPDSRTVQRNVTGEIFSRRPPHSQLTTPDGRAILRNVIRNKNAEDPSSVSYLYNLMSFKGCNSSGPDSQYRVRGGTQAIPLKIAELLESNCGGTVLLNSPVESVTILDGPNGKVVQLGHGKDASACQGRDEIIEVKTQDGRTFTSKTAAVTGAPPAVGRIKFEPKLPQEQRDLLDRMPMGRSMKFAAVYHRGPWWREHGLQGDILASGLPKELSIPIPCNTGEGAGAEESVEAEEQSPLFGYCFDLSPYSRKFGVLSCFVEGMSHRYFAALSEERRRELMREFLRLTFEDLIDDDSDGSIIWEPDGFVVGDWGPDNPPFVGGAYTSYFEPGALARNWMAYRQMEKLPNIFFAGADYHAGFGNGYIEGAVRSGQQAADLIRQRISVETLT